MEWHAVGQLVLVADTPANFHISYEEKVGREVIKGYVEFPHTENLVSKHRLMESAFLATAKRSSSSRNNRNDRGAFGASRSTLGDHGSAHAPRGNHNDRGSFHSPRGNHNDRGPVQNRSASRKSATPSRGDLQRGGKNGFSTPRSGQQSQQRDQQQSMHTPSVTSASSQPSFERTPSRDEKPKLQTMSVYVHEDGSITPAVPVPGASQGNSITRNVRPSISSSTSHSVTDITRSSLEHSPGFERFLQKASSPQAHIPVKAFTPTKQESSANLLRLGAPKSSPSLVNKRNESGPQLGSPLQLHSPPAQPQFNHHVVKLSPIPFVPGGANRRESMQLPQPGMQACSAATMQTWIHEHEQQRQDQQDPFFQAQYTQPFPSAGLPYVQPFDTQAAAGPFLPPPSLEPVARNQMRTPSGEKSRRHGHGVRGTETKSSIDLRTDSWVDKLLASPGGDSHESRTTGSFGGLGNLSDV